MRSTPRSNWSRVANYLVKVQRKFILVVQSQSKYLADQHFDRGRRSECRIYRSVTPLFVTLHKEAWVSVTVFMALRAHRREPSKEAQSLDLTGLCCAGFLAPYSLAPRPSYGLVLLSSDFTGDQFELFLLPLLQTVATALKWSVTKWLQWRWITPSDVFSNYHLQNFVGVKNQ